MRTEGEILYMKLLSVRLSFSFSIDNITSKCDRRNRSVGYYALRLRLFDEKELPPKESVAPTSWRILQV